MGWKYVNFKMQGFAGCDRFIPIIFPDIVVHADLAVSLTPLMRSMNKDRLVRVDSAGKIEHIQALGLGGDSETLRLKSNPKRDEPMILAYSYLHGIE